MRAPRGTVEHACGALGRAPRIHARLRRLGMKPGEKRGLASRGTQPGQDLYQKSRQSIKGNSPQPGHMLEQGDNALPYGTGCRLMTLFR